MTRMKSIAALALLLTAALLFTSACALVERPAPSAAPVQTEGAQTTAAEAEGVTAAPAAETGASEASAAAPAPDMIKAAEGYQYSETPTDYVDILMDDGQHIVIHLRPDVAPISVENFQKLVSEKFYDGIIFHRVIKDFMIQTGDPEGTGMGGSDTNIKGEFAQNGIENTLSHKRGVVSMARATDMNSASSQFFICHKDSTFLDGQYAAFGEVVLGMDEVDRIAEMKTDANDRPETPPAMKHVFFVTPAAPQ